MKFIKSSLCLMLAVITAFSCCSVAFSAEEENYPQVFVAGFGDGCVKIYYEDDPEQKSLFFPFETERFIKNIGNVDEYIIKSIKEKKPNVLRTVVYNYLMDCFGMLALNPDGSMMDGVTAEPVGLRAAGENKYNFFYDCRYSPMHTAEQLRDAVNGLLEETGSEKVELIGSSYGANIVTAYMYAYPEELDKVDTVLQCVPSIGGIRFLGELLSGNFEINPLGLCDFIHRLAGAGFIPDFFYLMEEADILDVFLEALVVPVFRKAIFEGVIDAARDFVATLPTAWVCVSDEYFDKAMECLYGENYKDPNHTYAALIAEMIHYHYDIANKATEIYLKAEQEHEGLNVAVITKFGIAAVPLAAGENTMDDGLVTVPVSSFGATCTTYGNKLPADYKQQKYTEYNLMSPEWNIDASTCAFPFSTWFIKGVEHSTRPEDYKSFVDEIVFKDLDIFTDPDRPQFLTVSENDPEKLEPLMPKEENRTFYDIIFGIFRKIFLLPKMIFEKN